MTISNCAKVFAAFQFYGPSTVDEIQSKTGMAHQQVSARACDLKRRKVLIPTGKSRLTRLGHPAQVLRVAAESARKEAPNV